MPPLLEGWKHKILLAGKYLNVIRECGIEIHRDLDQAENEDLHMDDEKYVINYFGDLPSDLKSLPGSTNLSKTLTHTPIALSSGSSSKTNN